jgi:hypothetical protein
MSTFITPTTQPQKIPSINVDLRTPNPWDVVPNEPMQEVVKDGVPYQFPVRFSDDMIDHVFSQMSNPARAPTAEEQKNPYLTQAGQAGLGGGEGLVSIAGMPAQLGKWGVDRAKHIFTGSAIHPIPNQVQDYYNANMPAPVEGYETTRKVASVAAPAVVEGLATGGPGALEGLAAGAPTAALRSVGTGLARSAVGNTAAAVGGEVGQKVGGFVGDLAGQPEIGADLGSAGFSAFSPSALTRGTHAINQSAWTDEGSQQRLADADIAGVRPSMDLVGSKNAAQLGDYTVTVPLAGSRAYDTRRGQFEDMDRAAQRNAADMRGFATTQDRSISPDTLRAQSQNAAQAAVDAAHTQASQIQTQLENEGGGPDAAVAIPTTSRTLSGLQSQVALPGRRLSTAQQATIPPRQAELTSRQTTLLPNDVRAPPGTPTITQQDDALLARRNALTQSAQGITDPAGLQSIQRRVASVDAQRQALRGQNAASFQRWNSELKKQMGDNAALDFATRDPIDQAAALDRTEAIRRIGGDPRRFQQVQDETRRLHEDIDRMTPITQGSEAGTRALNPADTTALLAMHQHAPTPVAQLLADAYEHGTRGPAAGDLTPDPEAMKPLQSARAWEQTPEATKNLMTNGRPDLRARADALARIQRADARRPTRTLPGAGGNTLGGGAMKFQWPAALGSLGIAGLAGSGLGPLGLIPAALPTIMSRVVSRHFTNPDWVRRVVNDYDPSRDVQRGVTGVLTNAVRVNQDDPTASVNQRRRD